MRKTTDFIRQNFPYGVFQDKMQVCYTFDIEVWENYVHKIQFNRLKISGYC